MRFKYFFSLYIFLISAIFAQQFNHVQLPKIGILQGTVIDSITSQPIQYASISLVSLRTNDIVTGGVTNEYGKFDIEQIPAGRYNISIEYIGYVRLVKGPIMFNPRENSTQHNLGNIKLVQSALAFQDVEVKGERPLFVQTIDKKIFNVEQNTLSSGGSALDVLRQVPGVDVDIDGNISLRGSSNVNVLINGKPSTMTSGDSEALLENIPADNIRDIEVVTNPSAKYDPEGMAGIINIILKENRFAGLNGNIKSGGTSIGAYNGSGQINFRNDKLNIFTNVGLRHDVRSVLGGNYRETELTDYSYTIDQEINGERGGNNILLKTGIDYFINKNNSIGLTASYSNRDRIHDRVVYTDETVDSLVRYYRTTDSDNDRQNIDIAITYDRKFKDSKQKLSVDIRHSAGEDNRTETQLTTAQIGYEDLVDLAPGKTNTKNLTGTTNAQIDYIHPISEDTKLEVGYKGTLRFIDNDFFTYDFDPTIDDYIIDDSRSNHFIFDENIQSGYIQYSTQKEKIGFQAGLRTEIVNTVSELKDTDENVEDSYTSIYPSAAISFGPPQIFQIQMSYSRRVHRPSYRMLNPAVFQLDQLNMRMGNPFLKPEYIDVMELNFSKYKRGLSLSLGAYYRRITDKISRYKEVGDDGISVTTYKNYDEQKTYGTELILSGSIGKKLRLMMNGNIYADEVNASDIFEDYNKTSTGFMGRVTATWNFSPTLELMLMGFYRSPRDIPIGRVESMSFTSISVKKKLLDDRFSVALRLNDVFNTMGFQYETYGDNYFQESSRKWDSQMLSINLEYKFGSIEDKSRYNGNQDRLKNENGSGMGDFDIE